MHRTIVVGSPRENGRSAALAEQLFEACIDECPDDGVSVVSVASVRVGGCTGCDACEPPCDAEDGRAFDAPEEGDPLFPVAQIAKSDARAHVCVIDDDMAEVRKHLDAADELVVVSPVYFASVPAQLKALMDRLQPYYRSNVRNVGKKRPLTLHIVGEGGDPHGVGPLVGCVRSAFSVAGFKLVRALDWRGRISVDGAIERDADELDLSRV